MHAHLTSAVIYRMDYLQAVVIGLIQGLFELFPLSSPASATASLSPRGSGGAGRP